jgi:hypothetical protein
MEVFENFGHVLVYGKTNSGKTMFTKYIVDWMHRNGKCEKLYVFRPERLTGEDWDGDYTPGFDHETLHDFDNNIKRIRDEPGNKIVVFDDYNKEINTCKNKDYINLFTDGRKDKIRVINLVHSYTAIAPIAKKNCEYCVIMAATHDRDEIKSLSSTYYSDWVVLYKYISAARQENRYNAIIISQGSTQLTHLICPQESKSLEITVPVDVRGSAFEKDIPMVPMLPGPSEFAEKMESRFNQVAGMSMPVNIGGKSAQYLQDRSVNNFNTKLHADVNQIQETHHIQHVQKIKQVQYKYEEELQERIYNCKRLLLKNTNMYDERLYLLESFNALCRFVPKLELREFDVGKLAFVTKYMPEHAPRKIPPNVKILMDEYKSRKHKMSKKSKKETKKREQKSKINEENVVTLGMAAARVYQAPDAVTKFTELYNSYKYMTS